MHHRKSDEENRDRMAEMVEWAERFFSGACGPFELGSASWDLPVGLGKTFSFT